MSDNPKSAENIRLGTGTTMFKQDNDLHRPTNNPFLFNKPLTVRGGAFF